MCCPGLRALGEKPVLPHPWGQAWPYLECSQEGLVASPWVQVLLCLVGAEQLTVASVRENIRFNTDSPSFLLKKVAKGDWKL